VAWLPREEAARRRSRPCGRIPVHGRTPDCVVQSVRQRPTIHRLLQCRPRRAERPGGASGLPRPAGRQTPGRRGRVLYPLRPPSSRHAPESAGERPGASSGCCTGSVVKGMARAAMPTQANALLPPQSPVWAPEQVQASPFLQILRVRFAWSAVRGGEHPGKGSAAGRLRYGRGPDPIQMRPRGVLDFPRSRPSTPRRRPPPRRPPPTDAPLAAACLPPLLRPPAMVPQAHIYHGSDSAYGHTHGCTSRSRSDGDMPPTPDQGRCRLSRSGQVYRAEMSRQVQLERNCPLEVLNRPSRVCTAPWYTRLPRSVTPPPSPPSLSRGRPRRRPSP